MTAFAAILFALAVGLCAGVFAVFKTQKKATEAKLRSVTRLIFITTQVSAVVWVFLSYAIAIYSTVRLKQVYTMSELSEPAIHTILGVGFMKVLENIFEHNDGGLFGKNNNNNNGGSV